MRGLRSRGSRGPIFGMLNLVHRVEGTVIVSCASFPSQAGGDVIKYTKLLHKIEKASFMKRQASNADRPNWHKERIANFGRKSWENCLRRRLPRGPCQTGRNGSSINT